MSASPSLDPKQEHSGAVRAKKREFADTAAEEPKLFVAFTEENHKEHEMFHFLLQWEGNEEALTLLHKLVDRADGCVVGRDSSSFSMSLDKYPISPTTIREISALNIGAYTHPITFCEGIIQDPPFSAEDLEESTKFSIAKLLDDLFFACRIKDIFKK